MNRLRSVEDIAKLVPREMIAASVGLALDAAR